MTMCQFTVEEANGATRPLQIDDPDLIVAGFTGRDNTAVQRHIAELKIQGIPAPTSAPIFWRLPRWLLQVDIGEAQVATAASSGEVEPVLLRAGDGALYVGVGSDHTDRELERVSFIQAKMACPKALGGRVWPLDDVIGHWDQLLLTSYADDSASPYQRDVVARLQPPLALLRAAETLATPGRPLALFLGTVPITRATFIFARTFRGVLTDTTLNRSLECAYRVETLA